ncbi:MAG: polysaccharide deacetylase family protein, partial [Planctomycetota bacterium]
RTLLRNLARDHVFIGYGEAVRRIESGQIDEPAIVISFDDGQRSCLQAARIMKEFGISACFFVCPSLVGVTDYHRIRHFCAERLEIAPVPFLSWDEVEQLVADGHEIGSHTWDHPDLAGLPEAEVDERIERARDMLDERLGRAPRHFAWPYGGFEHFSAHAARAVFRAGHASCASGVRGAHEPGATVPRPPCLRRDHVMASWPLSHCLYLLARSVEQHSTDAGAWPDGWAVAPPAPAPAVPDPTPG